MVERSGDVEEEIWGREKNNLLFIFVRPQESAVTSPIVSCCGDLERTQNFPASTIEHANVSRERQEERQLLGKVG